MACDKTTVQALLTTDGYPQLSERDRLVCLAYTYGSAAGYANAKAALVAAAANGYHALSDNDLDKCLLSLLC